MCGSERAGFGFAEAHDGWEVGSFEALGCVAGLVHAVTTRRGLSVSVAASRPDVAARRVAELLGLDGIAYCTQVHGADVLAVSSGGLAGPGDGIVTDRPGLGVMGFSADCPLILAADTAGAAVGIAHASWRGTVKAVAVRLVEAMRAEFASAPESIVACIGPSAGPCCYEVGSDVLQAAARSLGPGAEEFFTPCAEGKFLLDLWAANRAQLAGAGVSPEHIHTAGVCTICRNDLLPSYRVEGGAAGRFVAAIGRARPA